MELESFVKQYLKRTGIMKKINSNKQNKVGCYEIDKFLNAKIFINIIIFKSKIFKYIKVVDCLKNEYQITWSIGLNQTFVKSDFYDYIQFSLDRNKCINCDIILKKKY